MYTSAGKAPSVTHSHVVLALLFILFLAAPLAVSAQRQVPPALFYIAASTSLITGATIPPVRGSDSVPSPWRMAIYAVWAVVFTLFLVFALLRRPTWAQRRQLAGLLLFWGLSLTCSLVQGDSMSMLEGMVRWGPLAITVTLWLVSVLMEEWGVRRGGAAQAVELVGIL